MAALEKHSPARNGFDTDELARIRADFPGLDQAVHGKPLVYLDNAASAQKPRAVIERLSTFYGHDYANVHRGVHTLSQRATEAYEGARESVRRFLNAPTGEEIIFTKNATEAINLVASCFREGVLEAGDEIVSSLLEHHSNIVPWQLAAERTGARVLPVPIDDNGEFLLDRYRELLGPKTRLVAVTHVSNAIGTVTPIAEIIRLAHEQGVPVLVDGSQAAPHMAIDVQALDADFYVFTGHKVFGPSGIGVLFGKREWLDRLPPYQGGGDMIERVSFAGTTFAKPPHKFEAGTPPIAQAVGLGAAIDYVNGIGMARVAAHEAMLLAYATERLSAINSLEIVGRASRKAAILSFNLMGVHAHDVGTIVDHSGVAIRVGHHCAQPLMDHFDVASTARASFAFYNSREDVDALADSLKSVQEIFGR
ncbi:cysteine desulfurase [Oceanibacterium hippocampi]|uniref:cysteine desulfurase n=1 Tax=Oceanibacterium hippocampi TaxID=745714 RepID=A0A1Y5TCW8_9PROT|nr:cysteine desulfurase [Oceanibacterium hippocampi]SLN57584.1 putative cysteine desulfurase [Oceanibacterium hippocampi]